MRADGYNLGGEQSGHIVMADLSSAGGTTGDGLAAALQVLAPLVQTGRPASEIFNVFDPLPQVLRNVRVDGGRDPGSIMEMDDIKATISEGEARFNGSGRVLIRKSGTEPLIRVMAEGERDDLVREVVDMIADAMEKAAVT